MKRKMDFVTNSSSCAFIFIGWLIETGDKENEVVKEYMEIFGDNKYDPKMSATQNLYEVYNGKVNISLGDGENGLPYRKLCIGMSQRIDDDDSCSYSIKEIIDIDSKLSDMFHSDDIRIISGQEVC